MSRYKIIAVLIIATLLSTMLVAPVSAIGGAQEVTRYLEGKGYRVIECDVIKDSQSGALMAYVTMWPASNEYDYVMVEQVILGHVALATAFQHLPPDVVITGLLFGKHLVCFPVPMLVVVGETDNEVYWQTVLDNLFIIDTETGQIVEDKDFTDKDFTGGGGGDGGVLGGGGGGDCASKLTVNWANARYAPKESEVSSVAGQEFSVEVTIDNHTNASIKTPWYPYFVLTDGTREWWAEEVWIYEMEKQKDIPPGGSGTWTFAVFTERPGDWVKAGVFEAWGCEYGTEFQRSY
jgi:hypothetical protein